jgi:hypothetical protein
MQTPELVFVNSGLIPDQSDNKRQSNPAQLPEGYHFVKKYNGENAGMGFYCDRCKLHVPSHAPDEVRHCGTVSARPMSWWSRFRMKTHTLARRGF